MTIHKIANYSCSNLPENGAVWKNTDHFSDLITCADSSHTARAEQTVWEGVLLGRAQQADDGPQVQKMKIHLRKPTNILRKSTEKGS